VKLRKRKTKRNGRKALQEKAQMKKGKYIALVNIATVIALVYFYASGVIRERSLFIVAPASLLLTNGAALLGERLKK